MSKKLEFKGCNPIQSGSGSIEPIQIEQESPVISYYDRKLEMARRRLSTVTHFEMNDGTLVPVDEIGDYLIGKATKNV